MKYYDINSYSSCRPNKAIKDDLGCHKSQIQDGCHKNMAAKKFFFIILST